MMPSDRSHRSLTVFYNSFQWQNVKISTCLVQTKNTSNVNSDRPLSSNPFKHPVRTHTAITTHSSTSLRDGQEIRDSMHTALYSLKHVAETYRLANDRPSQLMEPGWMRWEKDETELETLNRTTRDLSLLLTDCFISPNNGNLLANQAIFGEGDDIAKLSWEIMERAMPKKEDQTWGSCAHEFFKALADILQQSSLGASGSRT